MLASFSKIKIFFRIFYKTCVLLFISLTFLITAFCGGVLCLWRPYLCRPYWYWLLPLFARPLLFLLGVRVKIDQQKAFNKKNKNFYIVSNHLGYLDILVILQWAPSLFITSFEAKSLFFLGELATLGGSLFVDRRNHQNMIKDLENTRQVLKRGYNITLFPEATSHNGEKLLPFKSSLLQAIEKSNVSFLPLCINYRSLDGESFQLKNRDKICWYGDMSFLPSIIRLFSFSRCHVELKVLEPISPFHDEKDEYQDRKALAKNLHKVIEQHFIPVQ